jgi:hypothetical protein
MSELSVALENGVAAVKSVTGLMGSGINISIEQAAKKSIHRISESFAEQNGELVGRLLSYHRRHLPAFFDIAQDQ